MISSRQMLKCAENAAPEDGALPCFCDVLDMSECERVRDAVMPRPSAGAGDGDVPMMYALLIAIQADRERTAGKWRTFARYFAARKQEGKGLCFTSVAGGPASCSRAGILVDIGLVPRPYSGYIFNNNERVIACCLLADMIESGDADELVDLEHDARRFAW